jgi:membrane protease YdiL (CAAX protease family)
VSSAPTLRTVPGLESLPTPLLVVVAALNSTILLTVFVLLGAATAPRVGLRSHVYRWATRRDPEWGSLRGSVPLAVGGGAALFVLTAVLDIAFAPFVNLDTGTTASVAALVDSIPIRLLYGGVTEELLLRWGVVAPVAWAVWRVRSRVTDSTPRPTDGTMWAAIAVSALLFGVGHLPALAASVGLTPALVVRTVLLNAVAGVGFALIGLFLFVMVANARLSDKFRAEEFRNRLRAVGLEDDERPDFLDELEGDLPDRIRAADQKVSKSSEGEESSRDPDDSPDSPAT